jgi:hypothetical protein
MRAWEPHECHSYAIARFGRALDRFVQADTQAEREQAMWWARAWQRLGKLAHLRGQLRAGG